MEERCSFLNFVFMLLLFLCICTVLNTSCANNATKGVTRLPEMTEADLNI